MICQQLFSILDISLPVLEIVVVAPVVIISRRWSVCVVVVVLVATSLLAIITLDIQVKILLQIKENYKNHLVDWRRGKVDGREVAVLGQRVGCCYLRLQEGIGVN